MGAIEERLDRARHGDGAAVDGFLRRTPARTALYAAWIEAGPHPATENARDAVLALDKAQNAGGLSRLTTSLAAKLGGADAALRAEAAALADESRREAMLARLRDAFLQLDPVSREVLFVRDLEGMTPVEACRVLVVSELVVRQRLERAREQLRARLALARRGSR